MALLVQAHTAPASGLDSQQMRGRALLSPLDDNEAGSTTNESPDPVFPAPGSPVIQYNSLAAPDESEVPGDYVFKLPPKAQVGAASY